MFDICVIVAHLLKTVDHDRLDRVNGIGQKLRSHEHLRLPRFGQSARVAPRGVAVLGDVVVHPRAVRIEHGLHFGGRFHESCFGRLGKSIRVPRQHVHIGPPASSQNLAQVSGIGLGGTHAQYGGVRVGMLHGQIAFLHHRQIVVSVDG